MKSTENILGFGNEAPYTGFALNRKCSQPPYRNGELAQSRQRRSDREFNRVPVPESLDAGRYGALDFFYRMRILRELRRESPGVLID
jgi:hypothetical protein